MLASAMDQLTRARSVMERGDTLQTDLVAPEISASWARCLELGLDPQRPPPLEAIDEAQLKAARDRMDLVRALALAEMQTLYHQIAGSNFLIAFASPDGTLLDTIADPSFRNAARTASIRPGTIWAEPLRGTNALGTVARTGQRLTVHGGEHFFAHYGALNLHGPPLCSAPTGHSRACWTLRPIAGRVSSIRRRWSAWRRRRSRTDCSASTIAATW